VLAPVRNERLVVTTDAVVEGVHFSRACFAPADIGHKALAVNLSDLAAMAATPQWALLSLVLPGDWLVADVEGLMDGFSALATRHGVSVVGGNITRTRGPAVVDVTAGGSVASRKWLTRSGGKPGDELWVSGTIGGAAAGLEMLSDPGSLVPDPGCAAKQKTPEPRVRLGVAMGRARAARAAMDLSDGLADAVRQLAAASGCGARLEAGALPIDPGADAWWRSRNLDPVSAAIAGGEEYELLFAVPKKGGGRLRNVRRQVANPVLTRIGVLTKDPGELVVDRAGREEVLPEGYRHFAERSEARKAL
jgi:thiamine-monophosphate kinase